MHFEKYIVTSKRKKNDLNRTNAIKKTVANMQNKNSNTNRLYIPQNKLIKVTEHI